MELNQIKFNFALLLCISLATSLSATSAKRWIEFEDETDHHIDQWIKSNQIHFQRIDANPAISSQCKNEVKRFFRGLSDRNIDYIRSEYTIISFNLT